ncbi:hypothetical protein [Acidiphilium sp. 34-64-41]|uniref:hypothetical protein n=1 Tax=Acidiphilium sp. 34-64-41 TaxID=1970297 RepID=UPI0025809DED|nr:hypothetical protein [Acidiphilium sp. 34-64-41]
MRRFLAGFAVVGLAVVGWGGLARAAVPRLLPDHDVMGVYRISQPGRQATGVTVLLDLASGSAHVVVPQMHAVVAVPGLSGLINKVLDENGAHFTPLGQARIAGHACTRYLVLKRKGDGTACITQGGVVLAATGKDARGSMSVTALQVADAPQPPGDFVLPQGYSSISLPPQMLAQLLGG